MHPSGIEELLADGPIGPPFAVIRITIIVPRNTIIVINKRLLLLLNLISPDEHYLRIRTLIWLQTEVVRSCRWMGPKMERPGDVRSYME